MSEGRAQAALEPPWVDEVLRFWIENTPPERRFKKDAAFDAEIASNFAPLVEHLTANPPGTNGLTPRSALAAIIVLDQFPRNIFRGSPRAFASDTTALALAKATVEARLDQELPPEGRLFVYLPFEHSEAIEDQDRSVALIEALGDPEWTRYAFAHRDIIRRFGRFPHRNAAVGRVSTSDELAFLSEPGSSF